VPLFVTSLVAQMMAAMKATGRGDLDHAGLVTLIEELSQTELSQKSPS
jgi:3-hydroxyisobutyrate dehydrogenase-like beta-hydroxyacid dehydrogenase